MKTYVHLWYVTQFFLQWEIFQTNFVEELEKHILWKNVVKPDRPQTKIQYAAWALNAG